MRRKASTFLRRVWRCKTKCCTSKWILPLCILSNVTSTSAWRCLMFSGSVWWLTKSSIGSWYRKFVQINANGYWRQKGIPICQLYKSLTRIRIYHESFFNHKPPCSTLAKSWLEDGWAWSPCGLWLCSSQLETLGWTMGIWNMLSFCMTIQGTKDLLCCKDSRDWYTVGFQ